MAAMQIEQLRSRVRGAIVQPDGESYESVRMLYNGMIDKRPALIVRMCRRGGRHRRDRLCADQQSADRDSRRRTQQWRIEIRGRWAGHRPVADERDPRRSRRTHRSRRRWCVWGDVDHATHPFGLAVPCGFISTTGVGGLTLGGGIGYLTRQYGLTIDNLLSADVVLADGSVVTADEQNNADLFWALRGGGGNFGVVTSFEFRAHPVRTVYAGPTFWPLEETVGGHEGLPRVHPRRARIRQRLFRVSHGSAGADVSRAPAPQEGVRCDLGVDGSGGAGGGCDEAMRASASRCSIIRRRCRCRR